MPFRRWFPTTLPKQAQFYNNFTRVFTETYESLGFTAEDLTILQADNALMQHLVLTELLLKTFMKAFRMFVKGITNGSSGGENSVYIVFNPPSPPPIVPEGMFERLFHLADRIVVADGYNDSVGARFGILPKTRESLRVKDLTLKLRAKALEGAAAEVRFTRGRTSGVNLYCRRAGDEKRIDLGRFFSSPAIVKIPLLDAAKPEQIYLFGRYLIGNDAVGSLSPMVSLVVTP
jgi:hypothetical protein